MPTPAEVDRFIAQAHQMRGDFIAQTLKSGLNRLRTLFVLKSTSKAAPA
jgi:hypothetical protein